MAKAAHALSALQQGRNPAAPTPATAALHHEWSAALCVWASLPPCSRKEPKVCRQHLELRGRLLVGEAGHA
jgi:hypothetical protein